jgi:hypothetical protein
MGRKARLLIRYGDSSDGVIRATAGANRCHKRSATTQAAEAST